jgi:gamma-glutamyltranspeptidase/glutathione hydrolase
MVVTAQHLATDVGVDILRKGGNAIDAAVAIGYALAVTHPCCGNLGGGGFMLIHLASGKDTFINFREKAPLAARADMFLDAHGRPMRDRSIDGYLAVGVPGTVLGLETARERYGTLPRTRLIAPAVALAAQGFILTAGDVAILREETEAFRRQPNVRRVFLQNGAALAPGARLRQPDLAGTLRALDSGGADTFYHGPIAAAVAAASRAHGGVLTTEDFARYDVTESAPLTCAYRGYTIVSPPPPSSGGVTLCEVLQILQGYPLRSLGYRSAAAVHVMAEAMRFAYHDRNTSLGDPAFVSNPIERLISPQNAAAIRARIDPRHATPSASLGAVDAPPEGATTTHYSVVDALGNAVAVTYTINDDFGAKVIAGNTGFFLNDEMDDFTVKPGAPNMFDLVQGSANAIAPGKRPLSSMTPTLVEKDGVPLLIVGSPGGARIISTVLGIIVDVIDYGRPLAEAVDAPRIHQQWLPDVLSVEPSALSPQTSQELTGMGYQLARLPPWGAGNAAEAVGIAPKDAALAHTLGFAQPALLYGASDARASAGSAAAP